MDDDRALIETLGGPAKVAELLGYDKEGGTQRVHNWLTRGIPASVKVQRPDLFLPHLATPTPPNAAATPAPVTRAVGEPCTAIETEAAAGPVACDDPAVVEAACNLGGEGPRNEYERYIGHRHQRAGDKPSGTRER